jgi:hypothetical protein
MPRVAFIFREGIRVETGVVGGRRGLARFWDGI